MIIECVKKGGELEGLRCWLYEKIILGCVLKSFFYGLDCKKKMMLFVDGLKLISWFFCIFY